MILFSTAVLAAAPSFAQQSAAPAAPSTQEPTATSAKKPTAKTKGTKTKAVKSDIAAPKASEVPRGSAIEKILVKGNRKIEADAIRAKLVSREGGAYNEDTI